MAKTRPLYFVMRTDMASMTPGRIAAQVAHGQSIFDHDIANEYDENDDVQDAFEDWEAQAGKFGTVIVLNGGTEADLEALCDQIVNSPYDYIFERIIDPEYVLRDGDVVHVIPDVMTGLYVFPMSEEWPEMKKLSLL